jgi:hypothetical protein
MDKKKILAIAPHTDDIKEGTLSAHAINVRDSDSGRKDVEL